MADDTEGKPGAGGSVEAAQHEGSAPDADAPDASPNDPSASEPEKEAAHDAKVDADEQPFLAHLLELRKRLLRSAVTVMVLFGPVYYFANEIIEFVAAPMLTHVSGGMLQSIEVVAVFLTPLKLSIYAAIYVAFPFLIHQVWGFVAPGLYLKEKRFAVPLLVSSIVLFYVGMIFAYYVVLPLVFPFLVNVAPEVVTLQPDLTRYVDFVLKMSLAFGLAFEIPVATVLLALSGIATPQAMANKRPFVVVGCFVLGMLLTPPDVISQVLLALPTWLLFEVGIILSRFAIRPREEKAENAE